MTLRELGYVEGKNLVVERRFAEGRIDRLSALARELVGLRLDIIVAVSASAIQAAKEATKTIPIVMLGGGDPVGQGFVASLARPGGNITGVALAPDTELASKRLSLIKEAVPRAPRIAVLTTGELSAKTQVEKARQAAPSLSVKLVVVEAKDTDYDHAFATMIAEGAGALFVVATPVFNRDRRRIHELAAKHRIPAIYDWPVNAEEGGLMAYGRGDAVNRRLAEYVVKILEGAKPAGALLPPDVREGHMLRGWLDSWSGVARVLDAMTAAGHHVELRQSVFGWRAEFYREAMQHSRSTWAGVGTDPLPWRAVQMGALDVLKRANREAAAGG
jgi:ABC-type uncharacterized transport system substrate-binding protein